MIKIKGDLDKPDRNTTTTTTTNKPTDVCGGVPADVPPRASARRSSWAVRNAATSRWNYLQRRHEQLSCCGDAGQFPRVGSGPPPLGSARSDLLFSFKR